MAGITSTGLGSGLDINDIVSKLVAAERAGEDKRLAKSDAVADAKISAVGAYKSALSTLRTSLAGLKTAGNFQKVTATSGDPTIFTATADKNAELGNYNIVVQQLAQSHSLVAPRVATADAAIGTGTLTIKFGATDYNAETDTYNGFTQDASKSALTIQIDPTNNTLTGLRDAINSAKAGVSASIINDGEGYRLILNGSQSGAKSSMEITVTDSDGNNTDASGLSQLAFNAQATNLEQMQTAQDAKFTVNGLAVTSASNTVKNTLKGVTLELLQAPAVGATAKPVSLQVTQSVDDVKTNVEGFVKAFNDLLGTVKEVAGYDVDTKQGGILQGEGVVRNGIAALRSELANFLSGGGGKNTPTLTAIGIDIQKDGTLTFDSTKLDQVLKENRDGVAALFSAIGRPSDSGILYNSSSKDTKAGEYPVVITEAASQGVLNGVAQSSLVVDDNNDSFSIKVDGVTSGRISLTKKDYSGDPSTLAAEIQSRINGDASLKARGAGVTVNYDTANSRFVIQSKTYGSSSKVEITAADTNSEATLGLRVHSGTADGTDGKDVAGSIGGVTAQGKGQELSVVSGPANGIKLTITDTKVGDRGTVTFARGIAEGFDRILGRLIDSNGSVDTYSKGLDKVKQRNTEDRAVLDERMADYEKRTLAKFNAMDALMAQFSSTTNFLTQQLANLPLSGNSR